MVTYTESKEGLGIELGLLVVRGARWLQREHAGFRGRSKDFRSALGRHTAKAVKAAGGRRFRV